MNSGNPIRVAVIGCGRMGRMHAERLLSDRRGVLAALYDPDAGAAQQLAAALRSQAAIHHDLAELLKGCPVDAAIIASPTQCHFEQASACLRAGCHVLCEKPLAATRDEITQLAALAGERSKTLMVGYQRRFWSIYRTLRREIRSGKWGAVRGVMSYNVENWQQTIAGTWRDDPACNRGGFIGDAGSHKIDAVFFATGLLPVNVFARCDHCGSRVEVRASVAARLTGDIPLTMGFVGHGRHFAEHLHVHCDEADLMIENGVLSIARDNQVERVEPLEPESDPVAGFLDHLCHGAANPAPAECALPVFDFTQAILESSRSGRVEPISAR